MAGRVPEPVATLLQRQQKQYNAWRESLTGQQQRLLDTFLFLSVFLVLAAPFYAILNSGWDASLLRTGFATATTIVLNLAGISATSAGSLITVNEFLLDVSRDSTGWKSVLAFTALVIASRAPLRKTVTGIGIGIGLILAANLLRLVTMIVGVTVFGIPYELLHTVLWRWGLTVIVLVTWLAWRHNRLSWPNA